VPVYAESHGRFSPALADQARVALYLATRAPRGLWHFFFAPNRKSSNVARLLSRVRRARTVQTVASVPRAGARLGEVLFGDRVVVLSAFTEERFLREGIDRARLVRIAPSVPRLAAPTPDERAETRRSFGLPLDAPVVLYPGDLEFGEGARLALEAHALLSGEAWLVLACRAKTERARERKAELVRRAESLGLAPRVTFLGETPRILALLAASDVVILPSETPYAKMDYPLVLLEAMMLARPVVVASATPAAELARRFGDRSPAGDGHRGLRGRAGLLL
jgi:glycosyltransferase involved in cell wall biosynthesis